MSLKYYGYTEREDPSKSMIDWAGLTKDISETITTEKTRRKDLKAAIDQKTEEQLNAVSEYEAGLEPSLDAEILKYSQNYKAYLMQQHQMMKNGIISVNDAKISKQGAVSTFKNLNALVKGYDTQLKEVLKNPTGLNNWLVGEAGNLLKLSNQKLIIDPKTGRGSFAQIGEDGEVDKNTITPIGAAANLFRPFQKFDAQTKIKNIVDNAAGEYSIAQSAYKTVSDITQRKDWDTWVDKQIDVMLGADLDGPAYDELFGDSVEITGDESKKGLDGYLFIENKGGARRAVLTSTQKENLKSALKRNIEYALDVKISKTPPPQQTPGERGDAKSVGLIDKFVTAGDVDALQTLLADNGFSGSTAPDAGGNIYLTKAGKTYTLKTKDRTAREVAEQLSGFLNLAEAYTKSGKATGALNERVTDTELADRYGTFARTSTVSEQSVANLQDAMTPGGDEFLPKPVRPQNVLNAAQTIARELNLSPDILTIDSIGGSLMINGKSVGDLGTITASEITQKLEAIAADSGAPTN